METSGKPELPIVNGDKVCQIPMVDVRTICGRPLHPAPGGVDKMPVCLMHSKDPGKQAGSLFDEFWQEFEAILESAADGEAMFQSFEFPELNLRGRRIEAVCLFNKAVFTRRANFSAATFAKRASFSEAIFMQDADFFEATFVHDAVFDGAKFAQEAFFVSTTFSGTASWLASIFLENAEFLYTRFSPEAEGVPSAVFAMARFDKPRKIVFDNVDLSRALFHKSDVSELFFTSLVRWGRRNENREIQIFEQTIPLDQPWAEELQRKGERNYRAIAQIYQQLKKNYDAQLDYGTANEFHSGEMEMKRLALPTKGRLLSLRRWIHPRLSLVALYKKASDYGNSYSKPMIWLLGFLLLFASLFPWAGLQRSTSANPACAKPETYLSVWKASSSAQQRILWEIELWGKSFLTALDTATFQKGAEYTPAYPLGRALAIAETLLTSSLFALFLLALRRQFRR